jgi:hypothetical protein
VAAVQLVDDHTSAFVYDWRHRFGLPLREVTDTAPDWWEFCHLLTSLTNDPTSHVAAAMAGWSRPWSPEAWILADLLDVFIRANSKRASRTSAYPRPNDARPVRYGGGRSQSDIYAALQARGHDTT